MSAQYRNDVFKTLQCDLEKVDVFGARTSSIKTCQIPTENLKIECFDVYAVCFVIHKDVYNFTVLSPVL